MTPINDDAKRKEDGALAPIHIVAVDNKATVDLIKIEYCSPFKGSSYMTRCHFPETTISVSPTEIKSPCQTMVKIVSSGECDKTKYAHRVEFEFANHFDREVMTFTEYKYARDGDAFFLRTKDLSPIHELTLKDVSTNPNSSLFGMDCKMSAEIVFNTPITQ